MVFFNRKRELEALEESLSGRRARFLVVYGRRRVGKTALLREFSSRRPCLFYTAEQATEKVLLSQLSTEAASAAGLPHLADSPFSGWDAFLRFLADWASQAPRLVILDEFPYLLAAAPGLASKLQKAWDGSLANGRIRLVVCGSSVSVMEQEVLGVRSPLYGRRTGQMRVEPLDFFDARLFLPDLELARQIEVYALLGGVPAYLLQYGPELDLLENVQRHVLHREAFLYEEPRFLLMQELREPRNYFAILRALAFGDTRLNDIVQHVGLDRAVVGRYLDILRSLGIVTREVPVTEASPERSRRGIYRLADHFLRFWFRFVHPNTSDLEARLGDMVARERVAPAYADFVAPVFEQVSVQWIRRVCGGRFWPSRPSKMGRWWDSQGEIDIAGLNEDGQPFFAECKWSSRPVGTDVFERLVAKSQRIEWASRERPTYAIFSRCGFTEALRRRQGRDLRLIDLDRLSEAVNARD